MTLDRDARDTVRVIPLGGLGEIGLNMMLFEYADTILVVDAGLMFPEDYMLGIDVVIPDISYLRARMANVAGIILTHGHEDHIGAMPFILREIKAPVYGTRLTLALLAENLKEFNLDQRVDYRIVAPREVVTIGPFEVECIRVCHSIADGLGLAIKTPLGVFIHSGDFKIDNTPVDGELTDLSRFSYYGERGVLALFSDSTNVEREGYTLSEREIGQTLGRIIQHAKGRVIVSMFASNIHRIQQVVDLARGFGRRVLLNGKSMVANVRIARELGQLAFPAEMEMTLPDLQKVRDDQVLMLTTGSQGEPLSALTRMAMDDHRQLRIKKGDTVILSSKFIPGNEKTITNMINHLYRRGAEVIYETVSEIHVSGHAYQEELKLMLNITRPRYFIPIHGEYRHLVKHLELGAKMGLSPDRLVLAEDGDVIEFDHEGRRAAGRVEVGRVLVDGKGVGDVGSIVLRDRRHLSEDGLVITVVAVNKDTGHILSGPDITSRGFVFEETKADILDDAKCIIVEVLEAALQDEGSSDWGQVKEEIRRQLRRFFYQVLKRRPVILPIIIDL
jgi:ribonuclease J